jgi:CheY-like chemotaxis protein
MAEPVRGLIGATNVLGNVLIVEDDQDTRDMLATFRHRAPQTPCLVLLDLKMPRLSGKEFRRAQLGDPTVASVPVAVMSGAADLEQRAQALGAVAIVAKPIDVDRLMDVVKRYCA